MHNTRAGLPAESLDGIAIIGLSGRFPGARCVLEFWNNLCAGAASITRFNDDELEDSFSEAVRRHPNYVKARPILPDVDQFDAAFFGMYAKEAELTDPQHRIFLECAFEALEDAGYDHSTYRGSVGVFAGCSMPTYFLQNVCADRKVLERFTSDYQVGSYPMLLGNSQDFLATRVSYKLDLRGPSITLQAACSTSLLAVTQACQSLLLYQSDMALAGGVSITFPQKRGYLYQEGGMVSPDGLCRTFDAQANGTIFGSGAGVVLLKRLEDALEDGDQIYAVIKGFGINNDGANKVGFTAPSVDGQAAVIAMAQAMAGFDARSLGYVECHGTATPLGDPIEFAGLLKAFRASTDGNQFCALGSAKANVGHLDVAAGVTGLIKTALTLRHGVIPPMANFTAPNPRIDLANSPFFINGELIPWPGSGPRRAGVSAFGVGGTNAHVVLEEPPALASDPSAGPHLVVLSARTEAALAQQRQRLVQHVIDQPQLELADIAFTLQVGRRGFAHRCAVVADDSQELAATLQAGGGLAGVADDNDRPVVFMFPGQGAQYPGMSRELYEMHAEFRRHVDDAADILQPLIGRDIRQLLFPVSDAEENASLLMSTVFAQPAIFTVEYALARLWMSLGVQPQAMVGHSIGEFAAACLADVFSLEDALGLIAARGRLMQELPGGAMVAVRLPEAELTLLLGEHLALAAINGPSLCVAAGPFDAVASLEAALQARGTSFRRLHTSHAFHSAMMDPMIAEFTQCVRRVGLRPPAFPYVSGCTGTWITAEQATSADYWARHAREPVRFADALATLAADEAMVLLEVGPGRALSTLALQAAGNLGKRTVATSLPDASREISDHACMLEALGRLWVAGVKPNWQALHGQSRRRRVSLPTYPFERQRYWIDAPKPIAAGSSTDGAPIPSQDETDASSLEMPMEAVAMDQMVSSSVTSTGPQDAREAKARKMLIAMLEDLSGESLEATDPATTFLEMGFDSLFLGQVAQQLQTDFGVSVTFRQLLSEYQTIPTLASHVSGLLPPEPVPQTALPADPSATKAVLPPITSASTVSQTDQTPPLPVAPLPALQAATGVENIIRDQLQVISQLMTRQLEAVRGLPIGSAVTSAEPATAPVVKTHALSPDVSSPTKPPVSSQPSSAEEPSRFDVHKVAVQSAASGITPAQRRHIDELIASYTKRTAGSKQYTQTYRAVLADPRAAAGFRPEWKEMVYPIVTNRSSGSKVWDIDGNEYIDLVNGFGQTAFGHAADFIVDAVSEQLRQGFEIGPQSPLAGKVAELFCELTGNERATFCNTGSEAVMAAMRIARAVTGRKRIAVFSGSYHGQFDEVLIKRAGRQGAERAAPVAPGIPAESVQNMMVLEYAKPASLQWIRDHASELAAVVVETVQSRHPDLRPVDFLRELRDITEKSGTALVFDEVVTGFRMHPGGMQTVFGIRADLATYGKVAGGGLPIGILAGTAHFMDALDGGMWRYGDDSYPEAAVTFFAGTFVRHPLAMAAVWAVLNHIKQQGPDLQERLAARTRHVVDELNAFLTVQGIRSRIETYGSLFYFTFAGEDRQASLLYYHLRHRGIHIQEGFPCFLTTAHSDADLDSIVAAFKESISALQSVGILGSPVRMSALPRLVAAERGTEQVAPAGAQPSVAEAPLTESQTEIWLSAQLGEAASCAFNESISMRFRGELDVQALVAALHDVIGRHDALRARFSPTGDRMKIATHVSLAVPVIDVSDQPREAAEAGLRERITQDAETPFDLLNGPLVRAQIVRLAADEHVLVLTSHHIVCDGWSTNIIARELGACYEARRQGGTVDLPAPLPFSLYAVSDADYRTSTEAEEVQKFWLRQFETLPAPLELPLDRPRPAAKSFRGATAHFNIGAPLYRAVKKAGARHGCTLFVTLLAAFQAVMGRLAQQDEIVVGVPTAGQSLLDNQNLVGHCVNFLPIRGRWDETTRFKEHLAAVKRTVLDAYDHQRYTLGTLVRRLALPRDLNRLPLTEVQFNLERLGDRVQFSGLDVAFEPNPKRFVNFDLFVNVIECADTGLRIDCDYSTDLFDEATILRWLGHYRSLLDAFTTDADLPVVLMPVMSEADRRDLLVSFNQTASDYPRNKGVHHLLAMQVARTPDRVAATFGDESLTYRELDSRANQLANHLRSQVSVPHARVGILVERSLDMLVALLGVLKAGFAYVPLDPQHPTARLRHILGDANVAAIVTSAAPDAALVSAETVVIQFDRDRQAIAQAPDTSPAGAFDADQTAYIIYTSGSTGLPKGVDVTHRSVTNFLTSMARQPGLQERDILLAVTTVSFDIAALELYLPLCVGARVAIASRAETMDGYELLSRLNTSGATVMQATPTGWQLLLEAGFRSAAGMKMLCGGEALSRALADRLLEGGGELWNMYGPTETTIWSAVSQILPDSDAITIGRPIANTQLYVLGKQQQLLPIGATGELFIGGDGLARGYFNRPDLTREKFLPHPFEPGSGRRIYGTGDVARRLPDGRVQVLGRHDQQVKLRGFRIELGEIEAVLARKAELAAVAVLLRDDKPGAQQLVGYYVEAPDKPYSASELRAAVADELPEYMIPAAWVRLQTMPTTPNGKIDRRALPSPVSSGLGKRPAFEAPSTPLEKSLCAIWSEVLSVDAVGIHDDLFAFGADSIHLFRIVARAHQEGIKLSAKDLLRHRKIAELSALLSDGQEEVQEAPISLRSMAALRHARKNPQSPASVA